MAEPLHESDGADADDLAARVSPDLGRDLGALFAARDLRIPPAISARILNSARARILGQSGRRRLLPLPLRWAGAAAAAAAVGFIAIWLSIVQPRREAQMVSTVPADVDGNGQVDILDALALARRLEANPPGARDVNKDGVADRGDVDAIAMLAVGLNRGGAQ